jgi:cysteine desulfurase
MAFVGAEKVVYLDCNATTPMERRVRDIVLRFMEEEFGNSGSRTHEFGARAKQAVQAARNEIAVCVGAEPDEVVFTSGATESNNLAILGLREFGERGGKRHVVTSAIEHKAVLEPVYHLKAQGFEVTTLPVTGGGFVDPDSLRRALRSDTVLVSIMHVNNETGVEQPLAEISSVLIDHPAYFHVDAAQSFGKDLEGILRGRRIDMISASSHKVFGPKGVGALIVRRREFERAPLRPLMFGGGQERGLRPGTLPVHLIAGFGEAARLARKGGRERERRCREFRQSLLDGLAELGLIVNGDEDKIVPHVLNASIPGLDSETFVLVCKRLIAVSNGSACTSHSYTPSHVLTAMGLDRDRIDCAIRFSWCHLTEPVDWSAVREMARTGR